MENFDFTSTISKFIPVAVVPGCEASTGLTVGDLRMGIREERLREFGEFSNHSLDMLEIHTAHLAGDVPLETVVTQSPSNAEPLMTAGSICSPSPYAWC